VVRSLEPDIFVTVLVCGVAGQYGGDVENDACFFVCERVLGGGFVCECIEPGSVSSRLYKHGILTVPCETNLDVVLVDWKSEI
jgi:hypothetical protein